MQFTKQDYQQLMVAHARRKEIEYAAASAVKNFADKLSAARDKDALELVAEAKEKTAALGQREAFDMLCQLAYHKLYEVGYKGFAELFNQALKQQKA